MKPLSAFLTDREIYILESHPQKTYQALGEELGITLTRVRQIKKAAERKIREEKRLDHIEQAGQIPVSVTLRRNELWVIYRALKNYSYSMDRRHPYGCGGPYSDEMEPDYRTTQALLMTLQQLLRQDSSTPLPLLSQDDDYMIEL